MMINGNRTIAFALTSAVKLLSQNPEISSPRLDCEILLSHVLNCERIQLILQKDDILSDEILTKFSSLVQRRFQNEPVGYLTGAREFMSLTFNVRPGILIPRPETEFLVEYVVDSMKSIKNPTILDLCTGSGAIAVSVAYYLAEASVVAVDKFDICVDIAMDNARENHVEKQVSVMQHDIFEQFPINTVFDCIVSNPPYIKKDILTTLPSDVKDYEPGYALDGGKDGLAFYRRIIELTQRHLKPNGILVLEIGYDQGEDLVQLLEKTNEFQNIKVTKDYAELDRMVTATKRG